MAIVYFDTETTDKNPGQICELSLIYEEESQIKFVKNYFFKVDEMNPEAQSVHGFSIEKIEELSNGLRFKDYSQEIFSILANNTLVAHNLPFDEKFISSEFWRCGVSFTPGGRQDTMTYFKDVTKIPNKYPKYGPYKNPKLIEISDFYNLDMNKVNEYCMRLFNSSAELHDSRFDTTLMYILVNIRRETLYNQDCGWVKTFCKSDVFVNAI